MSTGIGERRYPCRRCGGPLTWSPARRTLACQACGAALPPDAPGTSPAAVSDHPLDVCLHAEAYPAQHGDDNDMRCTSCRGIARFARGVAATNCPYCGSPDIVACDAPHDRQGPENIVPFLVEDELVKKGGKYSKGADWHPFAVVDGNLITGQNLASSEPATKAMLGPLRNAS